MLPELEDAGANLLGRAEAIAGFSMPKLETIPGDISAINGSAPTSFDLTALTSVGGDINFEAQLLSRCYFDELIGRLGAGLGGDASANLLSCGGTIQDTRTCVGVVCQ